MMKLKLAALAIATLLAAPASATLVRYEAIANSSQTYGSVTQSNCNYVAGGCSNTTLASESGFGLSGLFVVDTDKLPTDADTLPNRMYFDKYQQGAAASFVTATVTKSGGSIALPTATSDGGDRAIMYSNGGSYQLHAQTSASHGWQYEYHSNGQIARQYMRDQFIDIFMYNPAIQTSLIDGRDFATAFGNLSQSYLRSFDRITEYFFASNGQVLSSSENTKYVYGTIASINAAPVPEPAALALFGLGAAALGMRRRRRRS